jgi:hypothetical protein
MKLLNDFSNTANGQTALYSNITCDHNTAIGVNALQSNTTGHDNVTAGLQKVNARLEANKLAPQVVAKDQ